MDVGARARAAPSSPRITALLLMIGDNLGDFTDASKGSIAERQKVFEDTSAHWGKDWIAIPNPTYGSWESSAFGNDYKLSAEDQRRKKIEALKAWEGRLDHAISSRCAGCPGFPRAAGLRDRAAALLRSCAPYRPGRSRADR